MSGTNTEGTASSQDRARQAKRAGGNSAADVIEKHDQGKAMRIKQGGAGDKTTGKDSSFGLGFNGGGNSVKGAGERHDQTKDRGKSRDIPSNIEVAGRTSANGNCAEGAHESNNQKKAERVKASQRFDG